MKRRVSSAPVEMPSYRGVLSEAQLESVILYIRACAPAGPSTVSMRLKSAFTFA